MTAPRMRLLHRLEKISIAAVALAAIIAAALGTTSPARAESDDQYFDQLFVFGDSLLDTGTFSFVFTENLNGSVMSDYFSQNLGFNATTPAIFGGDNYATSGFTTQEILGSVETYTNANNFDGNDLIMINGGGNNLLAAAGLSTDAERAAHLAGAATTLNMALSALHNSGAQYIMVSNLPDASKTPRAYLVALASLPGCIGSPPTDFDSVCAQALAQAGTDPLAAVFNDTLEEGIAATRAAGANIIVADVAGFFNHVIDNPAAYGYDPELGPALYLSCYDFDSAAYIADVNNPSDGCIQNPDHGRESATPDPDQLIFTDDLHPTQRFHALAGDYMHDIVHAPTEIALLPEMGLFGLQHYTESIHNHLRLHRLRPAGLPMRDCFADLHYSRDNLGSNGPAAQAQVNSHGASIGCGADFADNYRAGLSANYTRGKMEVTGSESEFDLVSFGVAFYGSYTNEPLFVNGVANFAHQRVGADRRYNIGDNEFIASGDTNGTAVGAELIAGFDIHDSDDIRLAPAIGWSSRNSRVDAYTETGNGASTYRWGNTENDSNQFRAGAIATFHAAEGWIIHSDTFYVKESDSSLQHVRAAQADNLSNSYAVPAFQRNDDDFFQTHLSITRPVGDNHLAASWDYTAQGNGTSALNLTFRRTFQ